MNQTKGAQALTTLAFAGLSGMAINMPVGSQIDQEIKPDFINDITKFLTLAKYNPVVTTWQTLEK
jgi:hypothetical protein